MSRSPGKRCGFSLVKSHISNVMEPSVAEKSWTSSKFRLFDLRQHAPKNRRHFHDCGRKSWISSKISHGHPSSEQSLFFILSISSLFHFFCLFSPCHATKGQPRYRLEARTWVNGFGMAHLSVTLCFFFFVHFSFCLLIMFFIVFFFLFFLAV